MNKKLVALAVAAAFAAPVAMAQITLYGKVHADLRMTDDGDDDMWSINSNTSKLGFKGHTDLGDGMKALFKFETTYSGLDASSTLGSPRNTYIGLSGAKGALLVGRHDTPAKMAFYAAGNDHLGDSIIDFNKVDKATGAGFTEKRQANSVVYIAPAMSGFKVAVAAMPGEQNGVTDGVKANDDNGLIDSYSLGVMYKGNGIKAGFGYENLAHDNAQGQANNDTKMTQLGASYTFENITVGGQYENTKNYANNADQTKQVMGLAVKAGFGKNAVIANFSQQDIENSADSSQDSESQNIGVAVQHKINKRANVYLAFNKQETDDIDRNNVALGMMYSF
ncbi:MAG: porin [Pseudomonadota bacterium]